ncbi:hypothetical protein BASA83_003701 [Batrachochytrium salamandrivorans]|nr:hypothetical protein BASA83_003701 [Batrachochytrium salamandrivorans]
MTAHLVPCIFQQAGRSLYIQSTLGSITRSCSLNRMTNARVYNRVLISAQLHNKPPKSLPHGSCFRIQGPSSIATPRCNPPRSTALSRPFVSSAHDREVRPIQTSVAAANYYYTKLNDKRVVRIEGEDSADFLQGLVTNQVYSSELKSRGFLAAFLNAPGRVVLDAFIVQECRATEHTHSSYLLECTESTLPLLEQHLKKYKLRKKITISNISHDVCVWQAWGPTAHPIVTDMLSKSLVGVDHSTEQAPIAEFKNIAYVDPRHGDLGVRMILDKHSQVNLPKEFVETTSSEFMLKRLLLGIPEGPADYFQGQSLPLESNLDIMSGVDFRKGCYLGQELTIRTYHTGVTRKRIVPVQIYRETDPPPSSLTLDRSFSIEHPPSQSDIKMSSYDPATMPAVRGKGIVGKYCGGLYNIGLALVKLDHVSWPPGECTVDPQHELNDSTEVFDPVLILANGLRAKAFAPEWWPSSTRS